MSPGSLSTGCLRFCLLFFCVVIIWVFAQIHCDPILSRNTDIKPNELGRDFYLRVASFGALPSSPGLLITIQQLTVFSLNSSNPGELT
jgi:hypothetical protein